MISVSCRASASGSVVPQGPGKWNLEGSGRFRDPAALPGESGRGTGREGGWKEEEEEEKRGSALRDVGTDFSLTL